MNKLSGISRWINENSFDEEREEALAAIRQGLEDMYAGRTRSAREAIAELRRKHNNDPRNSSNTAVS